MSVQPSSTQACSGLVQDPTYQRLVVYLSGFDPQGPAHYHTLFATEGAKQAAVAGYRLETGPRRKIDRLRAGWDVQMAHEQRKSQTRYEFFRWDDIVRQHWPRGRLGLLRSTVFASWTMWRNGVMLHTLRTSWPMFLAAAMPGGLLLLLAVILPIELLVAGTFARHDHWLGLALTLGLILPATLKLTLMAEQRSHMAWLMRSLACLVQQGRGKMPELEERIDRCAERVAQAVRAGEHDEVLVVGHSSGAMLAMSVAARALRMLECDGAPAGKLALLTLGHCSPMLSAQAEAVGFRVDLQTLLLAPALCWVDYGAPPDGCAFPLVDPTWPVRKGDAAEKPPKLLNPKFALGFKPAAYQAVRRDKFRCHFQYLMASEQVGGFDFFAVVAGAQSLAQRHAEAKSVHDFRGFQTLGGPRR